ncbi:hypothetical protein VKT23_009534 [Stygiomarasmius scandens]|uniref:Argonaute-like protein n=1 Tax=Marasmiellus scandens TaxID=2682957 RepID=A0ABR1JGF3_9AGAR
MTPRDTRGGRARGAPLDDNNRSGDTPRGGPALIGRGPSAGQGILQTGPSFPEHVQSVGLRRSGYGTAGERARARVNAYGIEIEDKMIYLYDAIDKDKNYPVKVNFQLIETLQLEIAPEIFNLAGAYDGRKILYTPHKLNLGPSDLREFDVPLILDDNRPPTVHKVKTSLAAQVNTTVLRRLLQGVQSQDEQVSMAITALNVIVRAKLINNHPFNARSIFPLDGENKDVGHGLELIRGHFLSFRPAIQKLLLNIDISTAVFIKPGPLIDVALSHFNEPGAGLSILSPQEEFDGRRKVSLQRFLSNVRVQVAPSNRIVTINRLTDLGANEYRFVRNGVEISVAEYFRDQHHQSLQYPELICILTARNAAFPLEKCTVLPGQIFRKEIPPEVTKDMIAFSKMTPRERLNKIRGGVSALEYGQSDYFRQFGFSMNTNAFLEFDIRNIQPPKLRYHPSSVPLLPKLGKWNMMGRQFHKPAEIKRWVFVVFEPKSEMRFGSVRGIIKDFIDALNKVGITVNEVDPVIHYAIGQSDTVTQELNAAMDKCFQKNKGYPDLLVAILPNFFEHIYHEIKYFGDCVRGVMTQCLNSRKCFHAKPQYWANVCLKVNPRLNGINIIPDSADLYPDTIILGADVMHPPPGSNAPSYTAVVGSVDKGLVKYVATSNVQQSRVEIIADLYDMVKTILLYYKAYRENVEKVPKNKSAPKHLVFFRDGVSEGQFRQVLEIELRALKKVCSDFKIDVKITFVIVGKRHHYRFESIGGKNQDEFGNVLPGTVVDKGITHPIEDDFYLMSHAVIGPSTGRPSHYSRLYGDYKFTADGFQSLCYMLCYVYARATCSVSIPAPVYYADIVCTRAKYHFDPHNNGLIDISAADTEGLQKYKDAYKKVAPPIAHRMYFL